MQGINEGHMEEDPPTPFWIQSTSSRRRRRRHRHMRNSPSIFLKSGFLVLVLVLAAMLLFLFLVIPSVLVNLSGRPNAAERGWDSINLVLVIFAIVCGFLGRNDEDQAGSSADLAEQRQRRASSLKRSSSSYPDLRREVPWISEDDWLGSYDDMYLDEYYDDHNDLGQRHGSWEGEDEEVHQHLDNTNDMEIHTIASTRLRERAMATGSLPPILARLPPEPRLKTYSSPKLSTHRYRTSSNKGQARKEYRTVVDVRYMGPQGTVSGKGKGAERKMNQPPPPKSTKSTTVTATKPILSTNSNSLSSLDGKYSSNEHDSPWTPIPPPPPPFKIPSWKYVVHGYYARLVESTGFSPQRDYSEREEGDDEATASSPSQGTASPTTSFPSPDVNLKAISFINRFRSKLKLEGMHSSKRMQGNSPVQFNP